MAAFEIQSAFISYLNTKGIPSLTEVPLLGGISRADVVAIKNGVHGFEIKSDLDTLRRLPSQIASYSKVFNTVSIICDERHLEKVKAQTPGWFGLILFKGGVLIDVREAKENPIVTVPYILKSLTKREIMNYVGQIGLNLPPAASRSIMQLKKHLKGCMSLEETQQMFADCLFLREPNFSL